MKKTTLLLVGTLLTSACFVHAQSWFFNWDGTTVITCVPTAEGNNAFYQGAAANTNFYWEIVDNGGGGQAFRKVVTGDTGFRWYGYGSRPEYYRGPCGTFAMENLRANRNAFTFAVAMGHHRYIARHWTAFMTVEDSLPLAASAGSQTR